MTSPAVGGRSVLGRAIEKYNPGSRLGPIQYVNFDSVSIARNSPLNASTAITGSAGMDRGTPGGMVFDNKLKYDLTVERILLDLVAQFGAPAAIAGLGVAGIAPYRVRIRPGTAAPIINALTMYLFEGGPNYGAHYQVGRRPDATTFGFVANKRVSVDVEYAPPVGDSIAGLEIPATANTGTWAGKLTTRGRRPYDADYDNGLSVWIKIVSSDAGSVHYKVAIGTAAGDGTVPIGVTWGTIQSIAVLPNGIGDVLFFNMVDSTSGKIIGIFGENFEPFQINWGHTFGDLSLLVAGDVFEIPFQQQSLTKATTPENRISMFHLSLTNLTTGLSKVVDSGTLKLRRPYAPYFASGDKYSQSVDPTGDIQATLAFKKRLFDREFRRYEDSNDRFALLATMQLGDSILPSDVSVHEGIVIYCPQMGVSTMKSGDIANKNVLEETITLEAEQPGATAAISDSGGFPGSSSFEINVISKTNPASLGITVS